MLNNTLQLSNNVRFRVALRIRDHYLLCNRRPQGPPEQGLREATVTNIK